MMMMSEPMAQLTAPVRDIVGGGPHAPEMPHTPREDREPGALLARSQHFVEFNRKHVHMEDDGKVKDTRPMRLVSRYSVVDDIPKEGHGDSEKWADSGVESRGSDPASDSETDSSDSDAEHPSPDGYPILDPSRDPGLGCNMVNLYAHFIKIGDIDTKNQRFSAYVEIIGRWKPEKNAAFRDFFDMYREQPFVELDNGHESLRKVIPKISINNLENASLEKTTYVMKPLGVTDHTKVAYLEMHRLVKGVFYERLELESFPFDVQDICVRLSLDASPNFKIHIPDDNTPVGLMDDNTTFQDEQEWDLRKLVAAGENNCDGDEVTEVEQEQTPNVIVIRTNVQRKFNYFIYNCFVVMIFFAIMSYGNFANKPENVQFRLGGALTLVLTAVTYKLMLSNSLPTISYLTLIDMYVLFQIFMMTTLAVIFASLHVVWRYFADGINMATDAADECSDKFGFIAPDTPCELKRLANTLDVIAIAIHASIQISFNVGFMLYVYRKVKKETLHFERQEEDYRKFLDTHPEMFEMWHRCFVTPKKHVSRHKHKTVQHHTVKPHPDSSRSSTKSKTGAQPRVAGGGGGGGVPGKPGGGMHTSADKINGNMMV